MDENEMVTLPALSGYLYTRGTPKINKNIIR